MNRIAYHVTTLLKTKAVHLPTFVAESVQDCAYVPRTGVLLWDLTSCNSRTALKTITLWLDEPAWMRVSNTVLIYVQSYESSATGAYSNCCGCTIRPLKGTADFSITDFSSRLPQLLLATLGIVYGGTFHTNVYIVKEEHDGLFKQFRDQLRSENDALVESRALRNSRLLFKRPLPPSNPSGSQR
jgi:hypothetical protein